jgi:hypothetical protein
MEDMRVIIFKITQWDTTQSIRTDFIMNVQTKLLFETKKKHVLYARLIRNGCKLR